MQTFTRTGLAPAQTALAGAREKRSRFAPVNPAGAAVPANVPMMNSASGSRSDGWQNPAMAAGNYGPVATGTNQPRRRSADFGSPTGQGLPQFGPGSDMRFGVITPSGAGTPTGSAAQQRWQSMLETEAGRLAGVDRFALARDALADFDTQSAPLRQREMEDVARRSAALGRNGSAMTTQDIGDVQSRYDLNRMLTQNELLREATAGTVSDRFGVVNTLGGLYGQQAGIDAGMRGELRGERGYQYGVGEDARRQSIERILLEEQLYGNQFNRDVTRANIGNPAALAAMYGQQAGMNQNQAGQFWGGVGQLFGNVGYNNGVGGASTQTARYGAVPGIHY